jgi:hypothetical protein
MNDPSFGNIVALAGGVGGAKLAYGLYQLVPPEKLTIIVNTGDDFEHLGLYLPRFGYGHVYSSWHRQPNHGLGSQR